eukprot:CAMPEP_0182829180 /NCGR_PEP_ID=MMETSP0006_2-20121128/17880_1 /TAXON_ID=97485 /ORGANISM="Prymnesium parvum, Strain Texoma1" /LENGTH=91 /DNA_ID=CAMNT_0024956615 /DNA_START=247 /DNA_END=519 /DNA_ORIENTATION=-
MSDGKRSGGLAQQAYAHAAKMGEAGNGSEYERSWAKVGEAQASGSWATVGKGQAWRSTTEPGRSWAKPGRSAQWPHSAALAAAATTTQPLP